MTKEQPTISESEKSPSIFKDVTTRVFPLAANIETLQKFVDEYLNRGDLNTHEPGHEHKFYFHVSAPFVQMNLLSYGKMLIPGAEDDYISQREWLFMIALDWYVEDENGPFEFNGKMYSLHKYPRAAVTPYIFVDNALSVLGGREQYGWPKTIMKITPKESPWMTEPTSDVRLLTIEAMFLADVYKEQRPKRKPILQVDRRAGYAPGISRKNLLEPLFQYIQDFGELFSAQGELSRYFLNQWQQLLGFNNSGSLQNLTSQFNQLLSTNINDLTEIITDSIGLKQFRDADNVEESCYLAIANSRMKVSSIEGLGMLGSMESMMTSISGGYTIRLYNYEQLRIVEKLGLKVAETIPATKKEAAISILKPIMPYWVTVNLEYTGADPILMQAVHGSIINPSEDHLPPLVSEYSIKKKVSV